jgi:hypothetical protein
MASALAAVATEKSINISSYVYALSEHIRIVKGDSPRAAVLCSEMLELSIPEHQLT